jgi:hypothetical protein
VIRKPNSSSGFVISNSTDGQHSASATAKSLTI